MNRRRLVVLLGGMGAGAAVMLTLIFGVFSTGAEDVVDPESLALVSNIVSGTPDGTAEGIKVHGHWIIEVRDPDGTVVSRREFDNNLILSGRIILSRVLGRQRTVGGWVVLLLNLSNLANRPCATASGVATGCVLVESSNSIIVATTSRFKTLTVSITSSPGFADDQLFLTGTATAGDGAVETVQTAFFPCTATTTPADCASSASALPIVTFTQTTLGSPITVVSGQQILVNVTISFS